MKRTFEKDEKTKIFYRKVYLGIGIFIGFCLALVVFCSSCSVAPNAAKRAAAIQKQLDEIGLVNVAIINPNLGIYGYVYMFDGSDEVKIIPDARTGGWMFSRPAIAELKIDPASGDNWWTERWIKLPINSTYTFFMVGKRFWGAMVDRPYVYVLRVGDNPFAAQYWRHSPRGGLINCGGYIEMPYFYQNYQPLNIDITIRPGDYIEAGLHQIFGR